MKPPTAISFENDMPCHHNFFKFAKSAFVTTSLLGVAIAPVLAEADGNRRWIHGSWVNVRVSQAADSQVLTRLSSNTVVSLISQKDKACEISWDTDGHGFMPCRMLGDRPLTFVEVANEYLNGKNNPQYSPLRAFWLAPSMDALFHAGKHFQRKLLSEKQVSLENGESSEGASSDTPPRLIRYSVPEFDAMKQVLAQGIIASPDHNPPLLSCRQMQDARDNQLGLSQRDSSVPSNGEWRYPEWEKYPHKWMPVSDCQIASVPELQLPSIRPSLFRDVKELAPGSSDIERLSAHFQITERGRVVSSPKWERDYDTMRYTGAWDIGLYDLKLEKPVFEHVVGRTGLMGVYQWTPQIRVTPFGPSGGCAEGLQNKRMGKELAPGYPAVKDALLWFQAPMPLTFRTAKVTSYSGRPKNKVTELGDIERFVTYDVDINGDGIPDFVQWDIWANSVISLRQVFVNIDGQWYPFEQDSYGECT